MSDPVNHPAHYTAGCVEVIDVLEDAAMHAPDPVSGGLQWQALKYLLRMWLKGNPLMDAQKAQWYLDRLIYRLEKQATTMPVAPNAGADTFFGDEELDRQLGEAFDAAAQRLAAIPCVTMKMPKDTGEILDRVLGEDMGSY